MEKLPTRGGVKQKNFFVLELRCWKDQRRDASYDLPGHVLLRRCDRVIRQTFNGSARELEI